MTDLFSTSMEDKHGFRPLADRMRPTALDGFVGQKHLMGEGRVLRRLIESDTLVSMIFWGPPGVGKTTLARLIALKTEAVFTAISAVSGGVREVRQALDQARYQRSGHGRRTILFIDEIHRFNKSQQDALLHAVEDGTVTLIGATTENPSFEVNGPLLSRCRVFTLKPLDEADLAILLDRALASDTEVGQWKLEIPDEVRVLLVRSAGGDARVMLNTLELCLELQGRIPGSRIVTPDTVREALQRRLPAYDKKGEAHYDTISAFIKSVRGSDPDAAVYWLAVMLDAGEDPLFIARRLIILASEDIGNAEPYALMLANSAFQAVHSVGMPEARIMLSHVTTFLASAPKSNAAYLAVDKALSDVRERGPLPVPLHLRNAPTSLMKDLGYGKEYLYAHDFPGGFVDQQYLPDVLKDHLFYLPGTNGREREIRNRLETWWPRRRTMKQGRKSTKTKDKES